MAGAIAGTAILNAPSPTFGAAGRLHTIALTINNRCNLSCPHCYLQYRQPSELPHAGVLAAVLASSCRHLAVVGKEPLVDQESATLCELLARECEATGRTISIITNGHGLDLLQPETADKLSFIDVSLDGGAQSYGQYRGASLERVFDNVNRLVRHGFDRFNALHVLNERTLPSLDDMLAPETVEVFRSVMLQPYVVTRNDGLNRVSRIRIPVLLRALASNVAFREESRAFLLVDGQHLEQDHLAQGEFLDLVRHLDIAEKVRFYPADPLLHGFLRVTYDGYVLSPLDSLHPAFYRESAVTRLSGNYQVNLDDLFAGLLGQEVETCLPM